MITSGVGSASLLPHYLRIMRRPAQPMTMPKLCQLTE